MKFIDVALNPQKVYEVTEPGKYVYFIYNVSGEITVDIKTSGAQVFIYGLFIGHGTDSFSLHTTQHHMAPSSISDLFIKGVLYDQSRFVYEGLIRLEKEGQKSHAYQKNQNLILSPDAFIDSRPFLEILANDVFCTHGSTTGKLNKDQILYLQNRGISYKKAEEVLTHGFINDLFVRMEKEGCQPYIEKYKSILGYES
jgi:Fe-S cluster assembly protein SufD